MKKILIALIIGATLAITACDNTMNTPNWGTETPEETGSIRLSFSTPATRTPISGRTETWEKNVHEATAFVFDAAGDIKLRRSLPAAEITAAATTPISLIVPDATPGEVYDFIIVANRAVASSIVTKEALLREVETDIDVYNGSCAEVTTQALRPEGFAMTGSTRAKINDGRTDVAIVLKRIVAKVEVAAATTPAFRNKYGTATLTLDNITLSRCAATSYLLDRSTEEYASGEASLTLEQTPASSGNNLFYLFERPAATSGARVLLTIAATYDADGNAATLKDRMPVIYEVELTGAGDGKILRNGSYLLNASINGLEGSDISVTTSVADWETLVTSNIQLGR